MLRKTMVRKKRSNRGLIIGIVAAVVFLAIITFGLTQTFVPSEKVLTQYSVGDVTHFQLQHANVLGTGFDINQVTLSDTVTIDTGKNTFTFVSEKFGSDDTLNTVSSFRLVACFERIKVFKNGQQIDTIESWRNFDDGTDRVDLGFDGGGPRKFFDDTDADSYVEVTIAGHEGQTTVSTDHLASCTYYINTYKLVIADDDLDVDISVSQTELVEGEPIEIEVTVTNSYSTTVDANLILDLNTPTVIGQLGITESQQVVLQPGTNDFTFLVPLDIIEGTVEITPSLDVEFPGTSFSNLNLDKREVVGGDRVAIGTTTGNVHIVEITPEVITVTEEEVVIVEEEPQVIITEEGVIQVIEPEPERVGITGPRIIITSIVILGIVVLIIFIRRRRKK